MKYQIFIKGDLISAETKEAKPSSIYTDSDGKETPVKAVEAHHILNYIRVDENGKMIPLKIKSFIGIPKENQLIEIAVNSFGNNTYYKAIRFLDKI